MNQEKILCLDLSTRNTGYATYLNGIYQDSGSLEQKETDGTLRAYHILHRIEEEIERFHPTLLVVEKLPPMFHSGQEVLIYLHGGLKFLAIQKGIELQATLLPMQWRKILGFNQSKTENRTKFIKQQSIACASKIVGKIITDDNEADAICLGTAFLLEQEKKEIEKLSYK